MRGRTGDLLPLERAILDHAAEAAGQERPEFHGFAAAARLQEMGHGRMLASRGTLYKALDRLERRGLLERRWEDPEVAVAAKRPRRRLYRITASGHGALAGRTRPMVERLVERPL